MCKSILIKKIINLKVKELKILTLVSKQKRQFSNVQKIIILLCIFLGVAWAQSPPPFTDYNEKLERNIKNKKHGFLAGNLLYYVGGQANDRFDIIEEETIGFTHGYFRDGRSRGNGIATGAGGTGHDKWGWEFYRRTKIAYGTVIFGALRTENLEPVSIIWRPDRMVCTYNVNGVTLTEQKFITENDVLVSIITSSHPVTLEFDGHSFVDTRNIPTFDGDPPNIPYSQQHTAAARFDTTNNAIHILEGGTIMTKTDFGIPAVEAKLMYDSMSVVLSSTADFTDRYSIEQDSEGRQVYSFRVPCDQNGVAIAFAMGDDYDETVARVNVALSDPEGALQDKSEAMNDLLNNQIPYFRCSDPEVENTYYYLWALYFMYMIDVGKGWELYPHTQTAVNNFMGLHRYDACAYIPFGSWAVDKETYGFGNALTWKFLLPFARSPGLIPDNIGITWFSPTWGDMTGHVEGSWKLYEHSGDMQFITEIYDFYRELWWNGINISIGRGLNAANTLIKMAVATGSAADTLHWAAMRDEMIPQWESRWDGVNFYGSPAIRDINNITSMIYPGMPDEWARKMVNNWVMNSEVGYLDEVPLNIRAKDSQQIAPFVVSTLSTWMAVEGMFRHHTDSDAIFCTLGHIKGMNRDFGFPITPEAWDENYDPWGDMYYNWDGAIMLPIIERLAGIHYSVVDDEFIINDHLPKEWDFIETIVPVTQGGVTDWITVRIESSESGGVIEKNISVSGNSLQNLRIQPWLEDRDLLAIGDSANFVQELANGHADFSFANTTDAGISITLSINQKPTGIFADNFRVREDEPPGTLVTLLRSKDADSLDTHSYSIASGNDHNAFGISGDSLQIAQVLDFETQNLYDLRLRTTDNHSGFYEESFTLRVIDVLEGIDSTFADTLAETFTGPEFDQGSQPNGFWELTDGGGEFNNQGQYTVFTNSGSAGLRGTIGQGSFTAYFTISQIDWIKDFAKVNLEFWDNSDNNLLFFVEKGSTWMSFIVDMRTDGANFRQINLPINTPSSVKFKIHWNEDAKEWRVWYGLNGVEPTIEPAGSPISNYILSSQPERWVNLKVGQWNDGEVSADFDYFEIIRDVPVGIARSDDVNLPKQFELGQNYPNPFNPTTIIPFALPASEQVLLIIYDILGRKVKKLVNQQLPPGQYKVSWDGRDDFGNFVSTGIYIYRIRAGNYHETRKMLFIR